MAAKLDNTQLMAATRRATAILDGEGMPRSDFIRFVGAELGYTRTPKPVAKAIENGLRRAAQRGIVYVDQDGVYADCRAIRDYPRPLLKKVLLQAIGREWRTRAEAVTLGARHLGFSRTGNRIRAAFRSVISGLIRQGELEVDGKWIRRAQ